MASCINVCTLRDISHRLKMGFPHLMMQALIANVFISCVVSNQHDLSIKAQPRGRRIAWDGDPATAYRRESVKEAMLHAWTSYEKYAWGYDELQVHRQPLTKNGLGGLGITIVDSMSTPYIMDLKDQFQRAKEWVARSLDFNKNYDASVFETIVSLKKERREHKKDGAKTEDD